MRCPRVHLSSSLLISISLILTCAADLRAQSNVNVAAQDLKRLTIEELAELDVTSVSRRVERLSQATAAVSVLRQDDIRRTGVITLAEAMRLADGLDVARYDGRTWAVSARGFTISTANKLLVMLDGRTLYSPLFAGTFWDVQDTLLADIDRIEVIRGPGGALWGANAVNGVINIITKDASTTRGNAALLAVGSEERFIASARHGGRLGAAGSYRVFGKYRRRDANVFPTGQSADDELQLGRGGFRIDSGDQSSVRWTLQGDAYRGTEGLFDRDDTDVAGGNVLGRWVKRYSANSDLQVQAYYDRTSRKVPLQFDEVRDAFDAEVQRRMLFRRAARSPLRRHRPRDDRTRHRVGRLHIRSRATDGKAVRLFCAGRNRAEAGPRVSHRGIEVRAQRLHRTGSATDGARAVDARRQSDGMGRHIQGGPPAGANRYQSPHCQSGDWGAGIRRQRELRRRVRCGVRGRISDPAVLATVTRLCRLCQPLRQPAQSGVSLAARCRGPARQHVERGDHRAWNWQERCR